MTEKKFTELVNLYLDKEISATGLAELKAELAENAGRKTEFQERCRLHQAMRLALNPNAAQNAAQNAARVRTGRSGSRRSRRSRTSGSGGGCVSNRVRASSASSARSTSSVRISTRIDESSRAHAIFPRWILVTGLAACCAVAFVLLPFVFRDTTSVASQPALKGVEADELVEEDPLDQIGRAELRRFASMQAQRAPKPRSSLAAQLRLMGLRPELTPEEKQLRSVSLAAMPPAASQRDDAAFLEEVQKMTPMPEPQILRAESRPLEPTTLWPGGFQSSLASFK